MKALFKKYPNKIRFVYRHLPLDSIHSGARPAAEASECAAEQGKFWPYHDLIFDNPYRVEPGHLMEYAKRSGTDVEKFRKCLGNKKYAGLVQGDAAIAASLGISGTPAFVVGHIGRSGLVEGEILSGAQPLSKFVTQVERVLKRAKQ